MNITINPIIDNKDIIALAKDKLRIDKGITEIIQQENPNFSYKKLIADLGEFYAKKNIETFFKSLTFSKTRVSKYDLEGVLEDEYAEKWGYPKGETLFIEVKTRYLQKGSQHLGNIHAKNFHLLVFVSLNEDYSIHYLSMVKNSPEITITKNNKIIYNNKIKPIFATSEEFIPHR